MGLMNLDGINFLLYLNYFGWATMPRNPANTSPVPANQRTHFVQLTCRATGPYPRRLKRRTYSSTHTIVTCKTTSDRQNRSKSENLVNREIWIK